MSIKKPVSIRQPKKICWECGIEWGCGGQRLGDWKEVIFNYGSCSICGKELAVAKPEDYGYIKEGWEKKAWN